MTNEQGQGPCGLWTIVICVIVTWRAIFGAGWMISNGYVLELILALLVLAALVCSGARYLERDTGRRIKGGSDD